MRKSPESHRLPCYFRGVCHSATEAKKKPRIAGLFPIWYHPITLIFDCAEITSLQHSAFAYCPFSAPTKNARIGPAWLWQRHGLRFRTRIWFQIRPQQLVSQMCAEVYENAPPPGHMPACTFPIDTAIPVAPWMRPFRSKHMRLNFAASCACKAQPHIPS